jgi:hypothetical protein
VLLAGALVALRRRYPDRQRLITASVAAALIFELCPAPRTLFSAEIPSFYRIVAEDPRPLRVLQLPVGVRDGVSSAGNFTARSLYFQTLHGKPLIGGYLSRISRQRLETMRQNFPTLDVLITLSEGGTLTREQSARVHEGAQGFIERAEVGWVVIDYSTAPPELVKTAFHAFRLEEVAREEPRVLYRPLGSATR